MTYRIVNTDNFGRDYPDESFVRVSCEECGGRGEYLDAPGNVLEGRASMVVCNVCNDAVLEFDAREEAEQAAAVLNRRTDEYWQRYFMVVEMPYELQPGFEP